MDTMYVILHKCSCRVIWDVKNMPLFFVQQCEDDRIREERKIVRDFTKLRVSMSPQVNAIAEGGKEFSSQIMATNTTRLASSAPLTPNICLFFHLPPPRLASQQHPGKPSISIFASFFSSFDELNFWCSKVTTKIFVNCFSFICHTFEFINHGYKYQPPCFFCTSLSKCLHFLHSPT